jgi:hypothetical protein
LVLCLQAGEFVLGTQDYGLTLLVADDGFGARLFKILRRFHDSARFLHAVLRNCLGNFAYNGRCAATIFFAETLERNLLSISSGNLPPLIWDGLPLVPAALSVVNTSVPQLRPIEPIVWNGWRN